MFGDQQPEEKQQLLESQVDANFKGESPGLPGDSSSCKGRGLEAQQHASPTCGIKEIFATLSSASATSLNLASGPTFLIDRYSERQLGILGSMEELLGDPSGSQKDSKAGEARRPVAQWTAAEVCSWLRGKSLEAPNGALLEAANSHAISGKALLRLSEDTLERMGIAPKRLRQDLLQEILLLRIQQEMEELLDISDGE